MSDSTPTDPSPTDRTDPLRLWARYRRHLCALPELGFMLDISRMDFDEGFFDSMKAPIAGALGAMDKLEAGAIANPSEKRMVGHYWLRDPKLAPALDGEGKSIADSIEKCRAEIKAFASDIRSGRVLAEGGKPFSRLLLIGIGGSALGPQLACDALGGAADRMKVHFLDNTDPDGFDRTLDAIGAALDETLVVVVSKSGGTKETRNAALEVAERFRRGGLDFSKASVAVTSDGSELYIRATSENWLETFPMWNWVGGRTSEMAAVGLLPAALQGIDIDAMLAGARAMDSATRNRDIAANPAMLLALMWHDAGGGRGEKDMVILPYKDRLGLLSKYLQQLVMESLGKEKNLDGEIVNQGIAVYGNKGSTDQHAYVQQLIGGVNNFFVTFIEVLRDREGPSPEVEPDTNPGITSGDYLSGFLLGTRRALHDNGRESMTITIDEVTPRTLGMLIALFERAVGFYASFVNINAYDQPAVEAMKKAAKVVIELQVKILALLKDGKPRSAIQVAEEVGEPLEAETAFKILEHLAANPTRGVNRTRGGSVAEALYGVVRSSSPDRLTM